MELMNNKKVQIGAMVTAICLFIVGLVIYSTGGGSIVKGDKDNLANIKDNENTTLEESKDEKINENMDEEAASVFETVIKNENDLVILCNKTVMLGEQYIPTDLVVPNVPLVNSRTVQQSHLRAQAATQLEKMFEDAKTQGLEDLYLVSGYRSYDYQNEIFSNSIKNRGKEYTEKYMAKPGHSEHQTGLTADISTQGAGFTLEESFENTNEGKWLAENAHKYGFILRYPKDRVESTGYAYEPWHFRYVGTQVSEYMYKNDMILEDVYETVEVNSNSVG